MSWLPAMAKAFAGQRLSQSLSSAPDKNRAAVTQQLQPPSPGPTPSYEAMPGRTFQEYLDEILRRY